MKGNRFPIDGPRAEILAGAKSLKAELPLLLNPCLDSPDTHLMFEEDGTVKALSPRGLATIKVLGLNRSSLVEERARIEVHFKDELGSGIKHDIRALRAWLSHSLAIDLPYQNH